MVIKELRNSLELQFSYKLYLDPAFPFLHSIGIKDLFQGYGDKELGFIAQEVEPLFPSIVSEQDDDRHEFKVKSLGYNTFGVIAIGGIKELKNEKDNEIAELRSENETLKSRMETLTSEMAVLKARLANSTTQEDRIAKLEELVSKIGQGE